MRYLTVHVRPTDEGTFHPLAKQLVDEPSITREAIRSVELLADGTVLLFAEGSGDRNRYEEIMESSEFVIDYLVSGGDQWLAVSQFEPTDTTRRMLERQRESDLIIETPIHFNADGSLRVTYLGSDKAFQKLVQKDTEELPITYEVTETGEYVPDEAAFTRILTMRQREVLKTAVEMGYYSVPRESTLDDVAAVVGIAPTTAGDHLRKVEERVFESLVR
ncbi:helix-turn-helix domain-containing protein [Halostagnicola kamekurae]|uniref:HTH DNA binding domain-containing protein n=1 Tax=Halostagnicola kamekurae TaxID=619731 RepID=A0A1I6TRA2_9EURY|nr:helix-turn-helix domain-containing protein [Halostagnicola kamekurae]SFS91690.1 HTH DNA binding domain-containing protein [Halostagnicola kamekurae]